VNRVTTVLTRLSVFRNAGMSESLFERLSSSEGIITLNLNYRMNKTLTDLANTLTYEGQLQTGNEVVANRTLHIPNIQAVKNSYKQHQWLVEALDTSLEAAVKFIDTGPVWSLSQTSSKNIKSKDTPDSKNYVNVHEATIVFKLVEALIEGGVPNCDIGVIATYRAQVLHISTLLSKFTVDVSTVDQFQGRDKNVVIYSCTKSADMTRAAPESQSVSGDAVWVV
jgi:DNA replication ATP-dependent helicase Dna2